MLPQPQSTSYREGFNPGLCDAVPTRAQRVLEVGCASGRLGAELKRRLEGRYVAGVEIDAAAAQVAATRLDDVFVVDIEEWIPPIEEGSIDCIVLGDVLEHLREPEIALRRLRRLLADDGSVIVSLPNVQHASVLKSLLRGDFMYQPEGLLDGTHLRFFTHMSFMKLMCDAGFLPRIERRVPTGVGPEFVERATPLLELYGVSPDAAVESFDTYQYLISGTRLHLPDAPFAETPISFIVCSNDTDQLESNLRRSTCFDPGTPHELIVMRDQPSAADGYRAGLEQASADLVVFVHQDVYLPRGWDSQLIDQYREAERKFGPLGVAGAFGYVVEGGESTHLGRIVDRQHLLDMPTPRPALASGLDEVVLIMRRDTPLQVDPSLGFHLYGTDLALQAHEQDLPVAVLDLPCVRNSLFCHLTPAFGHSRDRLLEKWPDVRPLYASMGRLDGVEVPPLPVTWFDEWHDLKERFALAIDRADVLQAKLSSTEAELDDRRRHIDNMESSFFWKARNQVNRLLRRA